MSDLKVYVVEKSLLAFYPLHINNNRYSVNWLFSCPEVGVPIESITANWASLIFDMVFLLHKVHQISYNSLLRAISCTLEVTDTSFSVLFCQSAYQVHSFLGGIRTAQDKEGGKFGLIITPWKPKCLYPPHLVYHVSCDQLLTGALTFQVIM